MFKLLRKNLSEIESKDLEKMANLMPSVQKNISDLEKVLRRLVEIRKGDVWYEKSLGIEEKQRVIKVALKGAEKSIKLKLSFLKDIFKNFNKVADDVLKVEKRIEKKEKKILVKGEIKCPYCGLNAKGVILGMDVALHCSHCGGNFTGEKSQYDEMLKKIK